MNEDSTCGSAAIFARHAVLLENARDVRLPCRRPDQSLVKSVRLPKLEADAVDGVVKLCGGRILAEGMQDAPFMGGEISGVAGREPPQQRGVACFRLRHSPLALLRGRGRIEAQHLVHQPEIPIIVQQSLIRGDLGVHADPEAHVGSSSGGCANGSEIIRGGEGLNGRRQQHA